MRDLLSVSIGAIAALIFAFGVAGAMGEDQVPVRLAGTEVYEDGSGIAHVQCAAPAEFEIVWPAYDSPNDRSAIIRGDASR